mmetsp:Transcript_40909/g.73754  ORF Transcript_40909/g.73754 Transcript_40909/m.73754 type:complete len:232 (+) Transcript_40909:641-1336(+)
MDRIGISLCPNENDRLANRKKGVNIFQKLKLPAIILLAVNPDLFDDIQNQKLRTTLNQNLIRIINHLLRKGNNLRRKRRRKQQTLTSLGHLFLDQQRIRPMTTLGNHIIRLVQNEHLDFLRINNPPFEPVDNLARSANNNMRIQLGPPFDRHPRQRQPHLESLHVRRHGSDRHLKNLHGQLPRGCDAQRLARGRCINVHSVEHPEDEGGGFSGAGLCLSNDISGGVGEYPW